MKSVIKKGEMMKFRNVAVAAAVGLLASAAFAHDPAEDEFRRCVVCCAVTQEQMEEPQDLTQCAHFCAETIGDVIESWDYLRDVFRSLRDQ